MWGFERTILLVSGERPSPGFRPGFLDASGLRVTQAVADPDVLDLARRPGFDLIILDMPAPSAPALHLCRSLKVDPHTRSTPLIVVASEEASPAARSLGVEAIVHRPIVAREYHAAIGRFVRLPKRRVRRHVSNLRIAYEDEQDAGQAFTRDMSSGGAFLKTDRCPPIGARLRVRFSIPGADRPIECEAIVRRSAPADDERIATPGFAIEFCGIDEADQDRLDRFLRR